MNNIDIVEYSDKYKENVKRLLRELQEYIVKKQWILMCLDIMI